MVLQIRWVSINILILFLRSKKQSKCWVFNIKMLKFHLRTHIKCHRAIILAVSNNCNIISQNIGHIVCFYSYYPFYSWYIFQVRNKIYYIHPYISLILRIIINFAITIFIFFLIGNLIDHLGKKLGNIVFTYAIRSPTFGSKFLLLSSNEIYSFNQIVI